MVRSLIHLAQCKQVTQGDVIYRDSEVTHAHPHLIGSISFARVQTATHVLDNHHESLQVAELFNMFLAFTLLLFFNMVLASLTILSSPGEFTNPSLQATSNPSWAVGSRQVISWTTSLANYTIAIWNEDPSKDGYTRGPALLGMRINRKVSDIH
jgi:hypothetical protein